MRDFFSKGTEWLERRMNLVSIIFIFEVRGGGQKKKLTQRPNVMNRRESGQMARKRIVECFPVPVSSFHGRLNELQVGIESVPGRLERSRDRNVEASLNQL